MILNAICKTMFEINQSLPLKTVLTVCIRDENQQKIRKVDVGDYTKIKKYISSKQTQSIEYKMQKHKT